MFRKQLLRTLPAKEHSCGNVPAPDRVKKSRVALAVLVAKVVPSEFDPNGVILTFNTPALEVSEQNAFVAGDVVVKVRVSGP
jgi:hypothetical protein